MTKYDPTWGEHPEVGRLALEVRERTCDACATLMEGITDKDGMYATLSMIEVAIDELEEARWCLAKALGAVEFEGDGAK